MQLSRQHQHPTRQHSKHDARAEHAGFRCTVSGVADSNHAGTLWYASRGLQRYLPAGEACKVPARVLCTPVDFVQLCLLLLLLLLLQDAYIDNSSLTTIKALGEGAFAHVDLAW